MRDDQAGTDLSPEGNVKGIFVGIMLHNHPGEQEKNKKALPFRKKYLVSLSHAEK